MSFKKKRRPQLLSSTRPYNHKPAVSLSSRSTRAIVRTHHTLQKRLSSALASGYHGEAEKIRLQMEKAGGIEKYQQASIQGQSAQRGGDTSKVLVEWLAGLMNHITDDNLANKLRLLEVGALRTDNASSKCGLFEVQRIDLHSQHPDIKEQDFMARQIPLESDLDKDGFDVVSLSLVVNFVGDSVGRGEMLKRVKDFLRPFESCGNILPALFLVLPAACVTNSRYMDEDELENIMKSLGYRRTERKLSAKLVYYLWSYENVTEIPSKTIKKHEVRTGSSRNNFTIVLR